MAKFRLQPTDALPGSDDKIEVMRRRAKAGHPVFHPLDATMPLGLTPEEQGPTPQPVNPWDYEADNAYRNFVNAFQRQRQERKRHARRQDRSEARIARLADLETNGPGGIGCDTPDADSTLE